MDYLYVVLIVIGGNLLYGFGSAAIRDGWGTRWEAYFRSVLFSLALSLWAAAVLLP